MLFPMLAEACSFIVATPAGEFRGPEMLQKKIPSILLHAVFEDSYSNIACFHLVLLLVIEFKCAFGDVYTRSPIVQKLIELAKCEHYLTCDSVCLAPKKGYSAADNNSLSEKQ